MKHKKDNACTIKQRSLITKKWRKYPFYEEKKLVGLTPGLFIYIRINSRTTKVIDFEETSLTKDNKNSSKF